MKRHYRPQHYKPRSVRVIERKSKSQIIWSGIIIVALLYLTFVWILPNIIGGLAKVHNKSTQKPQSVNITLAPPVFNIPYESTNSGTISIPGYSTPNSKVELYLDDNLVKDTTTQDDGGFVFQDVNLSLGINNIYGKTISSDGQSSLPSKEIRLTYNTDKPRLDITEPEDNKTIKGGDKKVHISGSTDQDNTLTINNNVVVLNGDGHFSIDENINEGDNTITIQATNKFGNTIQIQRKVTYQSS